MDGIELSIMHQGHDRIVIGAKGEALILKCVMVISRCPSLCGFKVYDSGTDLGGGLSQPPPPPPPTHTTFFVRPLI